MPRPAIRNFIAQNDAKSRIGEISIRGYIGESNQDYYDYWSGYTVEAWGAGTVKELESEIDALNVDEIHLLVTSEGGDFFQAMTLADILNRHPARIVAIVEGYAFSAATVLICKCADEIRMASNAYMMIHDAEMCACGNTADMLKAALLLDKTSDTIAGVYSGRGGGDAPTFRKLMTEETYLTGAECQQYKLADTITDEVVLTNFKPHAARIRNAKTRDRLPEAIKTLFDSAETPTPKPTNHSPSPMTTTPPAAPAAEPVPPNPPALGVHNTANPPVVVPAASPASPAEPAAPAVAPEITNAVTAAVAAAIKPLQDKIDAQATEITNLRNLGNNGVLAASSGGAPISNTAPAPGAAGSEPTATGRARVVASLKMPK